MDIKKEQLSDYPSDGENIDHNLTEYFDEKPIWETNYNVENQVKVQSSVGGQEYVYDLHTGKHFVKPEFLLPEELDIKVENEEEDQPDTEEFLNFSLKTYVKPEPTSSESEVEKPLVHLHGSKFSGGKIKEESLADTELLSQEVDIESKNEATHQSAGTKLERDESKKWHHTSNKTGSLDDIGASELKGKRAGTEQQLLPKDLNEVPCFQCPLCPYKSKYKWYLMGQHMSIHTKDVPMHKCKLCSYKSPSKGNLSRHFLRCNQIFKCLECSYQTKYMEHLQTHQLKHESRDTWFLCPFCPYKTPYKYDLNRHGLIHKSDNEIKWYRCSECSFKTKRNPGLKRHKLSHLRALNKRFKCSECCYKTDVAEYFRQHSLKHKNPDSETWFKCCNCPYKSRLKSYLEKHQVLHRKFEEEIRCCLCMWTTHSKKNLVNHIRERHRDSEGRITSDLWTDDK